MKIYISAMAEKRADIERKLSGNEIDMLIEHLLYLLLAPNAPTAKHWSTEIYAFLHDIPKLKSNSRFPSNSQIYNWTYGKRQDLITDKRYMAKMLKDVCEKENFAPESSLDEIMHDLDYACVAYFTWIADELSATGRVTGSEINEQLREILGAAV